MAEDPSVIRVIRFTLSCWLIENFRPVKGGGWIACDWQTELFMVMLSIVLFRFNLPCIMIPAIVYNNDRLMAAIKELWKDRIG